MRAGGDGRPGEYLSRVNVAIDALGEALLLLFIQSAVRSGTSVHHPNIHVCMRHAIDAGLPVSWTRNALLKAL